MKLRLAASGEAVPPISPRARAQSWHFEDGSVAVVCEEVAAELRVTVPGVGVVRMARDSGALVGYPAAGISGDELVASFHREVVPRLHAARGAWALHASAVAQGAVAIALLGESHAGKSSLAFAWAVRRRRIQVADDALVLDEHAGRYRIRPLEFEVRLRAPVSDAVHGTPERSGPDDALELAALVIVAPEPVAGTRPSLARLAAREAFPLVLGRAFCFHLQSDEARRAFFSGYLRLVRDVPVFRLGYPHAIEQLDPSIELVEALLAEHTRSAD